MNSIETSCDNALSDFKVLPNLEKTVVISEKYHLFIQIPEEQDVVYVSINHDVLDENIHRLNYSLDLEDGLLGGFQVSGNKYTGEVTADHLGEEDKRDLDAIYEYIEKKFFPGIKTKILDAVKLSLQKKRFDALHELSKLDQEQGRYKEDN